MCIAIEIEKKKGRERERNGITEGEGVSLSKIQTEEIKLKMSYSSAVKKNMAATSYGGKSSNSTYIVQKASGSAYEPATSAINGNASKHSNEQYNNKYSMKVNSHLLDHGYGATPQSSYDSATSMRLNDDNSHFKGYTSSMDAGITKYYKVSLTE